MYYIIVYKAGSNCKIPFFIELYSTQQFSRSHAKEKGGVEIYQSSSFMCIASILYLRCEVWMIPRAILDYIVSVLYFEVVILDCVW